MRATERVLGESPFVVRREVRWSDCDPAGVVYTGRFVQYLLDAVALFSDHMAGPGRRLGDMHGVDTPCKAMSIEFVQTLWPNDVIHIECVVGEVRSRSYDILVEALRPDGATVFRARLSPICVRQDRRVGAAIPNTLRDVLLRHAKPLSTPRDG